MGASNIPLVGERGGFALLVLASIGLYCLGGCSIRNPNSPSPSATATPANVVPTQGASSISTSSREITETAVPRADTSRGYLTTPVELLAIKAKAALGLEPYRSSVAKVLEWADKSWDFMPDEHVTCAESYEPNWNFNSGGTPIVYAKALAYHLTGESRYAQETSDILQRIMTQVKTISAEDQACRLNFGWGTPELVAAADLLEDYWKTKTCSGPLSLEYSDSTIGSGNCKFLFQNWLVKNPYYIVSYSAEASKSNWGAAATNTTAYIADYLWDRPDAVLTHRNPTQVNNGQDIGRTPAEAFSHANKLAIDRMNGYGVEYGSSSSCDYLGGRQQIRRLQPVKSQITENGIIPEDARREEFCNIGRYNGKYQNYPQVHLGHNIQQCELMLRRGDRSCFDNVDLQDLPNYSFIDPSGTQRTTHLYPGRGSIERAIKAIIVDSNTEWRHDSALEVAYRYYFNHHTPADVKAWDSHLDRSFGCSQDICFGALTHGFAPDELPDLPPTVPPPLS